MLKRKLPDIIKKPMNSINSIENWTIVIGPIIDESIKFLYVFSSPYSIVLID